MLLKIQQGLLLRDMLNFAVFTSPLGRLCAKISKKSLFLGDITMEFYIFIFPVKVWVATGSLVKIHDSVMTAIMKSWSSPLLFTVASLKR